MSEIPRQLPDWYLKPITFRHLLTFLTSEKSNLILKISNPATFSPQFHIITLLSLFPFSLSARCLSLPVLSLFARCLSLFQVSLRSLSRSVWRRRAHRQPWVSHGRTSASRTAAPLFQTQHHRNITAPPSYPVTPSPVPASPRGIPPIFPSFFVCFHFWVFIWFCFIFWFLWVYFYLKQSIDSVNYLVLSSGWLLNL